VSQEPLLAASAAAAAAAALAAGVYVVSEKDLVYASVGLAILGSLTAGLVALSGYPLAAAFIVIVYVGAAVMFIIVSVTMLGGGGGEQKEPFRGTAVGAAVAASLGVAAAAIGLHGLYSRPGELSLGSLAEALLSRYPVALIVLIAALAATLVEGVTVARRR